MTPVSPDWSDNLSWWNGGRQYPFIPEKEFWLDVEAEHDERAFFIDHLLVEYRLMRKGVPYDKAHAESSRLEVRCRHHPDERHDALAAEGWS